MCVFPKVVAQLPEDYSCLVAHRLRQRVPVPVQVEAFLADVIVPLVCQRLELSALDIAEDSTPADTHDFRGYAYGIIVPVLVLFLHARTVAPTVTKLHFR